jgi:hypothetical protein
MLACGAAAGLAGLVTVLQFPAIRALGAMPAKGLGSALFDGVHGLQVTWGQTVLACGAILRAMASEDVRELDHERSPEDMRGRL